MGTPNEILRQYIYQAIADTESNRTFLSVLTHQKTATNHAILEVIGQELFRFFRCEIDDPPLTAYRLSGKHYRDVGIEYFHQWVSQTQSAHNQSFYKRLNSISEQSGDNHLSKREISFISLSILMEEFPEEILFSHQIHPSAAVLDSFGNCCASAGLIDSSELFLDPYQLLEFFCQNSIL
ncbi:MAG: hypothetical protein K8L97_19205 [Anaerolineae bacterium]|nr:hypothetical protein [Anaerolineae bacterium]